MRNRFAGKCVHCGADVPPQQGHFQKSSKAGNESIGVRNFYGRWLIRCVPCVEKIRKEKEEQNARPQ